MNLLRNSAYLLNQRENKQNNENENILHQILETFKAVPEENL